MTDDLHPDRRGGGSPHEGPDAAAEVVPNITAAESPEDAVPPSRSGVEIPGQRRVSADNQVPAGSTHGSVPTFPPAYSPEGHQGGAPAPVPGDPADVTADLKVQIDAVVPGPVDPASPPAHLPVGGPPIAQPSVAQPSVAQPSVAQPSVAHPPGGPMVSGSMAGDPPVAGPSGQSVPFSGPTSEAASSSRAVPSSGAASTLGATPPSEAAPLPGTASPFGVAPSFGPAAAGQPGSAFPGAVPAGEFAATGSPTGEPAPIADPATTTPHYDPRYAAAENPTPPNIGGDNAGSDQQYSYGPFHGGPRQPSGANPTSGGGPAYGAAPTSGGGPAFGAAPSSGGNPAYGAGPTSGGNPAYGAAPTSGGGPAYGEAYSDSGPPTWSAADSVSGGAADPYGFSVTPAFGAGPRIEPTPKQPRGRFVIPALAGLLAGLLLFGTGGWFLGRSTAGSPDPGKGGTTAPPAAPVLGPYEQNQIAINQPKLPKSLAPLSQGWLAHLSGCVRSGEKDGPRAKAGEKVRVRCEMDAMSVIFVEYDSIADRDRARVETLGQNVDARQLTPGVGPAVERAAPSGRTDGNYVEFAYQVAGQTVSGIWWDDSSTPVAAYLLAFWKEGSGSKWEPMRDIWARYA
ncbi:hypothetical protein [Actinoplanes sp. NPDC026623]|uniref:hypothetical protein n=1 Tax=Actinoplanes sp. NPDC026623 TaxID=3155610 RepID=UPI0033D300E2